MKQAKILVIGCASVDTLHHRGHDTDKTTRTIGGAGLYTALGAALMAAGQIEVSLLAPRPQPFPEQFEEAARFINWLGPHVAPERMPRLEIAHHGNGNATLLSADWGSEAEFDAATVTADFSSYDIVHIAALSSAQRQLEFARRCRQFNQVRLSAGTYARIAYGDTERVGTLLSECDYFFMNANEAKALVSNQADVLQLSDGVIYVTEGEGGVTIYQGGARMHVEALKTEEIDATGAGDSFCGAVLAAQPAPVVAIGSGDRGMPCGVGVHFANRTGGASASTSESR